MPVPAVVSPLGVFAGVTGGMRLSPRPSVIVDLGQTSAKVLAPGLPARRVMRRGRGWQAVLRDALWGVTVPHLVLGLPSELSAEGAGACSYFDALSWKHLATEVPCDTQVFSDAELAAGAVDRDAMTAPCLALTFGHGVGAALVLPG